MTETRPVRVGVRAEFPGLAIGLAVFGLNMVGDAIRDLTDVKLRGRESQSE